MERCSDGKFIRVPDPLDWASSGDKRSDFRPGTLRYYLRSFLILCSSVFGGTILGKWWREAKMTSPAGIAELARESERYSDIVIDQCVGFYWAHEERKELKERVADERFAQQVRRHFRKKGWAAVTGEAPAAGSEGSTTQTPASKHA